MIDITRQQAAEGAAICDKMLGIIARLQADFATLKTASDNFSAELAASAPAATKREG